MQNLKLLSLNISLPKTVAVNGKEIYTGIYKTPVTGKQRVNKLNIEGDGQADLRVHGGEYKAVYAYAAEHYDYWRQELEREDLPYGAFGENLTISGLLEEMLYIGDRKSRRSGVYFRVIEEGEMEAGNDVTIENRGPDNAPFQDVLALFQAGCPDPEAMRKLVSAEALAPYWKKRFQKALDRQE